MGSNGLLPAPLEAVDRTRATRLFHVLSGYGDCFSNYDSYSLINLPNKALRETQHSPTSKHTGSGVEKLPSKKAGNLG